MRWNETRTMRRALCSCGPVAALVISCTPPAGDRYATTEQRFETVDEGGVLLEAGLDASLELDAGNVACAHAPCAIGENLSPTCDPCVTQLCALDPYCCTTSWDATCVGEVKSICGESCTPPPAPGDAGPSTCAHSPCVTGSPLVASCEPCAADLCAQDPYCCAVAWDATCVGEVAAICGTGCN